MNQIGEETPLLITKITKATPLPWLQFTIVLFLQLSEPLTAQVIYPFAPQLIREIGITHGNEKKVGYYVGMLQSLFFLAQATTSLHWSRASDRIGRRPVILIGLFGLSISMTCFGLSKTFWGLVFSRSLSGLLNGNTGVIKSIVADITDSSNIAQAYAYMPIAWSTGGGIGPFIGGSLSHPAEQYPTLFGTNQFLKEYPYFLPSIIPAMIAALASLLTFLFLNETVKNPVSPFHILPFRKSSYESTSKTGADREPSPTSQPIDSGRPVPFRALLTPRVLIASGNYASVALIDIAFRAIQPVFFATPIHLGGLGLDPSSIGKILSIYGILNGIFQVLCFARIHNRWGSKRTFMAGILLAFPMFGLFPVINWAAKGGGWGGLVKVLVGVQVGLSMGLNISFGAVFIFIAAASPNRESLGATNGLSQTFVSIMRAIGPALANSMFSLSIEREYLGGYLVYYVLMGLTGTAWVVGSYLPRVTNLRPVE